MQPESILPDSDGKAEPWPAISHAARPSRISVEASVMLNPDVDAIQAMVCDVSEQGLKIAVDRPFLAGPISVKLPGFPIFSGEVRWRGARYIGVRLLRPVPWDFLTTWVAMHGSGAKD